MGKFKSKNEVKRMLLDNITLMENNQTKETKWVEFHEIKENIQNGFIILNEDKRQLYEKLNS